MSAFSVLSDDVTLNIILKLEDDPRDWARIACVCTKFSSIIRSIFWKNKCFESVSSTVSDLLSTSATPPSDPPPGTWNSLRKLCVCCPGLLHAGILLENSDFGLERELGPDEKYQEIRSSSTTKTAITHVGIADDESRLPPTSSNHHNSVSGSSNSENCWSLFDDLYFDTIYDVSESQNEPMSSEEVVNLEGDDVVKEGKDVSVCRKRKNKCRSIGAHLATGSWNLSREQGDKLLASRFRGDCLYICDWPGCVHTEEKRNYMLFRGVFKNFKRSRVWRTITDGNRSTIALDCAFCSCKETWDLHSAFCLKPVFGYHDDGEPVVRAYVCENGHVSGAWTDRPMYT